MKRYILVIFFIFWQVLPASAMLSTTEEKKLGEKFIVEVKRHLPLIDDPIINNYINNLGQTLVSQLPSRPFTYHFYVIDDSTLNAFAGPGGHIFIYRGLFLAFENEDELAGVIAHECGHVVCRHIADRLENSKKLSIATLLAILAGGIITRSPQASAAIATTAMATSTALSLSYSREDEEEADRTGLKLVSEAGYNGKGTVTAFKKLARLSLESGGKIPPYLLTHPALPTRITYIEQALKSTSYSYSNVDRDQTKFKIAHARLRALYGDVDAAFNSFSAFKKKNPQNFANHYGLGLCAVRKKNWQEALVNFKKASSLKPDEPIILRELGICHFYLGQFSSAIGILEKVPEDAQSLFYLGRAYQEKGLISKAISTWKKCVKINPDYAMAYYYLAKAYANVSPFNVATLDSPNLKERAWSHYYLGIYFKLGGKFPQADYHFKKALMLAKDEELKGKLRQILDKK